MNLITRYTFAEAVKPAKRLVALLTKFNNTIQDTVHENAEVRIKIIVY